MRKWLAVAVLALAAAGPGWAEVRYSARQHTWSLTSGNVEYRLMAQDGLAALAYFGPAGKADWPGPKPRLRRYARFEIGGQVEGQFLTPEDLQLISQDTQNPAADRAELILRFQHRRLPLMVEARYTAWGDTGVFTRQLTLVNRGDRALRMESAPSLAWLLPPGSYSLDYLHGGHGEERQPANEKLGVGVRAFVNRTGRSSNGYSSWFSVHNETQGVRYAAQLAWPGNWQMSFEPYTERRRIPLAEQDLRVELGMRFDFGGPGMLAPGASFRLPAVAFTASAGDLDDIANQFHRYQRRYVIPRTPTNTPLITQFNSWTPLGRSPQIADIKKYADLAAELGLESLGTDAAWVIKKDGKTLYGDWRADPVGFPHGIRELSDYLHAKGMKFSVWLEPESTSKKAPIAIEHPEWILKYNGVAMEGTLDRVYLDFRRADVRAWTRAVVDHLVRDDKIDWLKVDYNADVGDVFDGERTGTVLYEHLRYLTAWLDEIRAAYPNLIVENCSSGALRLDLEMIAHTHFTWMSDIVSPRASAQLAYGCTLEFAPEVCFHWVAGDDHEGHIKLDSSPGWWDFMFRIAMHGPYSISSRALEWSAELKKHAAENVTLYKRLRTVIAGADVYHLTPAPAAGENPTGWMALEYCAADGKRSAVTAFRLGSSEPRRSFALRGLHADWKYAVLEDGRPAGSFTGKELATEGLRIQLADEWRSAVVELTAAP